MPCRRERFIPLAAGLLLAGPSLGAQLTGGAKQVDLQTHFIEPGKFRLGLGVDWNYFPSFSSTVGDQPNIKTFSGDNSKAGFGGFLEYQPVLRQPLLFGVGAHYTELRYKQAFNVIDPSLPDRVRGTVHGANLNLYAGYAVAEGAVGLKGFFGLMWAFDHSCYRSYYGPTRIEDTRNLLGLKANIGGALDFPVFRGFDGRLNLNLTTPFRRDADTELQIGLGVTHLVHIPFLGGQ
jgi:hypothetical protein